MYLKNHDFLWLIRKQQEILGWILKNHIKKAEESSLVWTKVDYLIIEYSANNIILKA